MNCPYDMRNSPCSWVNRPVPREVVVKPFLKWAGGKSRLIPQFQFFFPPELLDGSIEIYCEPFLGGGALFFWLTQQISFKQIYLYDISGPLILIYRVIQQEVNALIENLQTITESYLKTPLTSRADYFYRIRQQYNQRTCRMNFRQYKPSWISCATELLFLNKTCYNGLFRFNKKGEFNAPFGQYKNPKIFYPENLKGVSRLLQPAILQYGPFEQCKSVVNERTFIYFDPPYRPLNSTSRFTSYSRHLFGEAEQLRLARLCKDLHQKKRIKFMLSNSDPKNQNPNDDFFERTYKNFFIHRVHAKRLINSKKECRGTITELLITNYKPPTLSEPVFNETP
ncbi:MAG: Dam family site-specific DNA-(adenine-N6)-methyltransferase [Planctomycetota bacterium]